MPHGKQAKKRANAKKKGNRGGPGQATEGSASTGVRQDGHGAGYGGSNDRVFRSLLDNAKDSMYVRYKKSTQRLKNTLQSMVPKEIFQTDQVDALMEATDYIVANELEVDGQLLRDLKLSIQVRKRVAADKYGGGDEGHAYFIAVLVYCWSNLFPRRRTRQTSKKENESASAENQFEKLSTADDTESETDDEHDLPERPQARPTETVRLTLQELLTGTDRSNVILFLMTLGELMGFQAHQCHMLNEAAAMVQREGHPPDTLVEQMMEVSVAANLAIQQVASLEQVFIHDHPHLNTVYRVCAALVLPEFIQSLTTLVARKSPIASQFTEKHAIEFLGDAVECTFRNESDPNNKRRTLVPAFLKRWQFRDVAGMSTDEPDAEFSVQQTFDGIQTAARMEAPLQLELNSGLLNELSSMSIMKSHDWLRDDYIGKNRSITKTIRLLQGLSTVVKPSHGRLVMQKGYFGTAWGDRTEPATRIPMDMDELLMGDIMPALINMCHEGMMAMALPFEDELLAGFVQIKMFVKYPERPVSWTLAFTVHSILTGIFEVQGPNAAFLAQTAESAFNRYLVQLQWAERTIPSIPVRPPIWDANVRLLQQMQRFVQVNVPQTRDQTLLAFWNPYCAGTLLSYVAYYGNLEGGMSLVDSMAQLRVALHLFNALEQAQAISLGQIELLDFIFATFKDCKAIWEGPLPVKGQYCTRWWIAFGMKVTMAQQIGISSRQPSKGDTVRKMTPIELEHLSKSFRRIIRRDFVGVADKYHTNEQRKKHATTYKHAVQVNDTLDAMEEDEQLLGTNLICLGFYLNQFFIDLFDHLGWMPLVDEMVRTTPVDIKQDRRTDFRRVSASSWEASDSNTKYQAMYHMFAERVMAPLDEGDAPLASQCAEFMKLYFSKISPEMIMWFTPTKCEE